MCLLRDGKREGPAVAPGVARLVPVRVHPPPTVAPVRVEHERVAAGIGYRLMQDGDIPDPEALHLLVGNRFPDEKGELAFEVG